MDSLLDNGTVGNATDYAKNKINSFIENVEDLTHALKNVDTPEIAKVKAKVKIEIDPAVIKEASERMKNIAIFEMESVIVRGNERSVTFFT